MYHKCRVLWWLLGLSLFPAVSFATDGDPLQSSIGQLGAGVDQDLELGAGWDIGANTRVAVANGAVTCVAGQITATAITVNDVTGFPLNGGGAAIVGSSASNPSQQMLAIFHYTSIVGQTFQNVTAGPLIDDRENQGSNQCAHNFEPNARVYALDFATNAPEMIRVLQSAMQNTERASCSRLTTGNALPALVNPGECVKVLNTQGTACTEVGGTTTLLCINNANNSWDPLKSATATLADTATALAADPAPCDPPGTFVTDISAAGALTCAPVAGAGTVTSIAATSTPTEFTLAAGPNPITASGTITLNTITQAAHAAYIGPNSGPNARPTFRALTADDLTGIGTLNNNIAGTAALASALTPAPGVCVAPKVARGINANGSTTAPVDYCVSVGTGTVTSVGVSVPADILSVAGAPVTSAGTITFSKVDQLANFIFAGPNGGGPGPPTFRAMQSGDLPATVAANTTGQANTALALTADGANCLNPHEYANGVSAAGAAQNCERPGISDLSNGANVVRNDQGTTWGTVDLDMGAANYLKVPTAAGPTPTADGRIAFDSTGNVYKAGDGTSTKTLAFTDSAMTGTSAFATDFDHVPAVCGAGEFAKGIDAHGDKVGCEAPPGGGTVTSVSGASTPTEFTLSGGPITGAGTLTLDTATQTQNRVYAGPGTAPAAKPTFRQLVPADLPTATTSAQGAVQLADSNEANAAKAVTGTDARLSDNRNPLLHGSSHTFPGTDPIPSASNTVRGTVTMSTASSSVAVATDDVRNSNTRTPSNDGNLAHLDAANAFSNVTGQSMKKLLLPGSSSGTLTVQSAAAAGTNTLTLPAGTTDFSATGGASYVVQQNVSGGGFTVGQLAVGDLSTGTTGVGSIAMSDSAVLTTPTLGDATVSSLTGIAGTGTDQAGIDTSMNGGPGTGTGKSGAVRIKTAYGGSSGSTPNVLTDRLIFAPERTLTDAQTSLFEIALPAGGMTGGAINWCIEASDGTDMQIYCGLTVYAAVNKAAGYTMQVTQSTTVEAKAVSAGTLTATWGITSGADKVILNVSPSGSLDESTGTYRLSYSVAQNSPHAVSILN